jgi:membrane protein YqaA with SNARE-associated domain
MEKLCSFNGYKYNEKERKKIRYVNYALSVILLIIMIISIINFRIFKEKLTGNVEHYGFIGLFLSSFFIELVPNFLNPLWGLGTALLSGLNFYKSLLFCILGVVSGSLIGFELGRRYGLRIICALSQEKTIDKTISFVNKYGNAFMFLGAVSPLPYFPIVFGALFIKRRNFLLYGLIPRILFVIIFGILIKYTTS